MKIVRTLCLLCLPLAVFANTTIYQSKDKSGDTVFSSKPSKGAKAISIPPSQTFTPKTKTSPKAVEPTLPAVEKPIKRPVVYHVSLAHKSQIVYRTQNGAAVIHVNVSPLLSKDETLVLQLTDHQGNVETKRQTGPLMENDVSFVVQAASEGKYTVQARVVDSDDNVLTQSPEKTMYIYLHRRHLLKK